MVEPQQNVPTILCIFGATGDLARVKVVPALFHLHRKGQLPDMFRVIGFSRRPWGDAEFRTHVREIISMHASGVDTATIDSFLERFGFQSGDFDEDKSYMELKRTFDRLDAKWGVCANKLFYLAVAPEFYTKIATQLKNSHLSDPCGPYEGWTRIAVEKPFGHDALSARAIDDHLAMIFNEGQIYRIDHYLAKEMLQNILTFRFANNLFESEWGNQLIEKIEIRLLEPLGVEKRGSFYDATGTLRDVGQNHFLQILALLTMDQPRSLEADEIRTKRAEILKTVKTPTTDDVKKHTFRAQYKGFRDIPGVAPQSNTETYFKVRATLSHRRWKGVPIYMEGGKRLGDAEKEIVITFKHREPCVCPEGGAHHTNRMIIRLEPKEEILIEFWSKTPGRTFKTEKRALQFLLRERSGAAQYTEEYEKMLLDCIRGDQTLFLSSEEIAQMWRYIDPIVLGWKKNLVPLDSYVPNTKDILQIAAQLETNN
ncbi:glucose-6-phosphate dehydrogenase [Candidatus Kaiserbacteria bacterium]|nr:glucose-6-phosphate dehydrogenase [Candidatus Kaiserbacteria bacterium]